jgi:DNA/RNA-binding domain of Phe-tRNA-synthetase-like protein
MLTVAYHPLLAASSFTTAFPAPLARLESPAGLQALVREGAEAPVERSEELRKAVRDLLRHGGYKPTGRGKPSCEYLVRAVADGSLSSINLAVDACNAVSFHSGLPISVIDLGRATPPFRIEVAPPGASYVFNASGQEIDLGGLLCLMDEHGPCANAVKDAQRTKTDDTTTETLSVVWGVAGYVDHVERTVAWYRELLERAGATTAGTE